MKKLLAVCIACFAVNAHAQDWFEFEAGVGMTHAQNDGDGQWIQYGVEHKQTLNAPSITAGFTGTVYEHGAWSLHYHADYSYMGEYAASCNCVEPDTAYDAVAHQVVDSTASHYQFTGHGHTNAIALTLEPGYTWHGTRFSIEGGPLLFWETWHETAYDLPGMPVANASHHTEMNIGYILGARIERGNLSVSYRYMRMSDNWNPYPGFIGRVHMLSLMYRF